MSTLFSIGTLARRTGYSIGMIRYFEKLGVISPAARTAGNFRMFTPLHIQELAFVSQMQNLGFYTAQIKELRALKFSALAASEKEQAIRRLFVRHLGHIERKIEHLVNLRAKLEEADPSFVDTVLEDCDPNRYTPTSLA